MSKNKPFPLSALDSKSPLIGNQQVRTYLQHSLRSGRIGQSYLFCGPEGIGKCLFAIDFAKQLLCSSSNTHPDLHLISPSGKLGLHSIDTLRAFKHSVALTPLQSHQKIFIIDDADRMLPSAANALLKTFEEPSAHTLIILISNSPTQILPTIRSRCRTVRFHSVSQGGISSLLQTHHGIDTSVADTFAHLAQGSIGKALDYAKYGLPPERQELLNILSKSRFHSWSALSEAAKTLAEHLDKKKVEWEEEEKNKIPNELPAAQRELMEKQIEGAVTLNYMKNVRSLLYILNGWYRDRHLLMINGSDSLLYNLDYKMQMCAVTSYLPSLEYLLELTQDTEKAIQRSIPLQSALENLFLKLQFL